MKKNNQLLDIATVGIQRKQHLESVRPPQSEELTPDGNPKIRSKIKEIIDQMKTREEFRGETEISLKEKLLSALTISMKDDFAPNMEIDEEPKKNLPIGTYLPIGNGDIIKNREDLYNHKYPDINKIITEIVNTEWGFTEKQKEKLKKWGVSSEDISNIPDKKDQIQFLWRKFRGKLPKKSTNPTYKRPDKTPVFDQIMNKITPVSERGSDLGK